MSAELRERVLRAREELKAANRVWTRFQFSTSLPFLPDLEGHLAKSPDMGRILRSIDARDEAGKVLKELDATANWEGDEQVKFCGVVMDFDIARRLCVQAYLAAEWTLVDQACSLVGHVLCVSGKDGQSERSDFGLVADFVGKRAIKSLGAMQQQSFSRIYGWPVAVSYAFRNHFLHSGGEFRDGKRVLADRTDVSNFPLSIEGASNISSKARENLIEGKSQCRRNVDIEIKGGSDLREILFFV